VTKEIAEFIGREYTCEGDIRWTVENKIKFVVPESAELPEKATATDKRIWERRADEYVKRENKLAENCQTV
jgi:NTP pyrophosphatase (non-canonical NTP hydrolase)